jgi:hypothetical protein
MTSLPSTSVQNNSWLEANVLAASSNAFHSDPWFDLEIGCMHVKNPPKKLHIKEEKVSHQQSLQCTQQTLIHLSDKSIVSSKRCSAWFLSISEQTASQVDDQQFANYEIWKQEHVGESVKLDLSRVVLMSPNIKDSSFNTKSVFQCIVSCPLSWKTRMTSESSF